MAAGRDSEAPPPLPGSEQVKWRPSAAAPRQGQGQGEPARPLILITEPPNVGGAYERRSGPGQRRDTPSGELANGPVEADHRPSSGDKKQVSSDDSSEQQQEDETFEEIDGIKYRIVAAVTKPQQVRKNNSCPVGHAGQGHQDNQRGPEETGKRHNEPLERSASTGRRHRKWSSGQRAQEQPQPASASGHPPQGPKSALSSVRRKSSAFVSNLLHSMTAANSAYELAHNKDSLDVRPRRMSIYEMTKSPPPETSIEHYLNERRRSSTVSATFVAQQLEQQSTFEQNYCQRQQYFKDLNEKLINQDRKLLNVVANRGQIQRHSVDIAQLPLEMAQAKGRQQAADNLGAAGVLAEEDEEEGKCLAGEEEDKSLLQQIDTAAGSVVDQEARREQPQPQPQPQQGQQHLASISEHEQRKQANKQLLVNNDHQRRHSFGKQDSTGSRGPGRTKQRQIIRKFQKLDPSALSATPAPDVKIGQRVAYKEYYGNEFGTIRWIGRVPQISPDWTAGIEFDNAIGEGDGSLNGRRYFIAKDCFAKFLPLESVAFVDQHVGRPEPGTMISVMSASVRPGQMISIQRVSTVHVQHCFLNAPHRRPGADILAVNTRLHCQCPNCGPCAHVVKPPRTQRLRTGKNATHMCQFSTYTCCGMESSDEALCTYTGNKISSLPPPDYRSSVGLPPVGNSWIEGSGYLSQLQAQQSKLMPEEYRLGAGPQDYSRGAINKSSSTSSRRASGGKHNHHHHHHQHQHRDRDTQDKQSDSPIYSNIQQPACLYCTPMNEASPNISSSVSGANLKLEPAQNVPDNQSEEESLARDTNRDNEQSQFSMMNNEGSHGNNDDNNDNKYHHENHNGGPSSTTASLAGPEMDGGGPEKARPGSKVLYRDSIDNRYLFPTDDAIDSTLEADLENLSQARYGHCTSNGANSAAIARRLNGSRNLLRGLRSLVSCLSAKSNQSSDGFERRSENTLRFFGQPSANEGNNKSQPTMEKSSRSSSPPSCSSSSSSIDCHQKKKAGPIKVSSSCDIYPFGFAPPKHPHHNFHRHHNHSHHHHNNHRHRHHPYPTYEPSQAPPYTNPNWADKCYQATGACRDFKASSSPLSNVIQHQLSQQQQNSQPNSSNHNINSNHLEGERFRSLGDSSSEGACSLWGASFRLGYEPFPEDPIETMPFATTTSTAPTTVQVRRQISSSSDCGFSSASQNSINLQSSYPSFSPIMANQQHQQQQQQQQQLDDEQRRINQIYKRIVAKLISSSTANITNEDLLKLKKGLFEMHSNAAAASSSTATSGCCLHQSLETTNECDQIIADIIEKSYLNLDNVASINNMQCHEHRAAAAAAAATTSNTTSTTTSSANFSACCANKGFQSDHHEESGRASFDGANCVSYKAEVGSKSPMDSSGQVQRDELPLSGHQTHARSSSDAIKHDPAVASLPRAFELKLTLSINSEDKDKKPALVKAVTAEGSLLANRPEQPQTSPASLIDINFVSSEESFIGANRLAETTNTPVEQIKVDKLH